RLDHRLVLPLLEGLPRLVVGIAVVEPADIAERDAIAVQVVHEAAAIGMRIGGPAEAVHDPARRDPAGRQLPQFLDADRIALRIARGIEREALDQLLGQAAACALGEHGDLRLDVDAFGIAWIVRAVLRHTHVADAHAGDRAVRVMDGVGGGEAREYVHAQRFGLRRHPGAHRAQRDDEVAVIAHAGRHRQLAPAGLVEQPELVLAGGHADRRRSVAPARQQRIQRLRLDHRAGQDLRADRRGLLDDAHADVRLELLQADRERQTGWAGADHDDVVFHGFAFAHGGLPRLVR